MVILLSLNKGLSVAQPSFALNAFIMLLSITKALGPKLGTNRASTGRNLLPR